MQGNKEKKVRNDFTIDRLKWKMGTSALTTAEITFNGADSTLVANLAKEVDSLVTCPNQNEKNESVTAAWK